MLRTVILVSLIALTSSSIAVAGAVAQAHGHGHHHHHHRGCNTTSCDHRIDKAWAKKHPKPKASMTTVLASWYSPADSGGRPACGYGWINNGVAHKTLACGTRVRMCAQSCITAIVADRGPYIAGREYDLMPSAKSHLGCSDLCSVRVRVIGRGRGHG